MIDDAFGHWLAGLIDGEGCFIIARKRNIRPPRKRQIRNPKVRVQFTYRPEFHLALRADDGAILEGIRINLGFGRAFFKNAGHGQLQHTPMYLYAITKNGDLPKLVTVLDRFPLRSKKAFEYQIWKQAVWIVNNEKPDWAGSRGLKLEGLRNRLTALRPLNRAQIPAYHQGDNVTARRHFKLSATMDADA